MAIKGPLLKRCQYIIRVNYPYNEALDDLAIFFKQRIKDEDTLKNMLSTIKLCRTRKTVALKGIYYDYMDYIKNYNDKFSYSSKEDQMWKDLLYFWQ